MKKVLFGFVLLLSVAAIIYFVAYPAYIQSKEQKEKVAVENQNLPGGNEIADSMIQSGWVKQEIRSYSRRDIPTLENEFYAIGYPPFLYIPGDDGTVSKDSNSGEKSYHDNGMEVYLYMDSSYYMTHAKIEYGVSPKKFNSTSMNDNIPPILDFAKIITGMEVNDDEKNNLLRAFADLFNDSEHKTRTVTINGLQFNISLDTFYSLIIMQC